jgi:hypothetical protein
MQHREILKITRVYEKRSAPSASISPLSAKQDIIILQRWWRHVLAAHLHITRDKFCPQCSRHVQSLCTSGGKKFLCLHKRGSGPGNSVVIATGYRQDGPEIESRWGGAKFSAPVQTGPGAHPASCTMCTGCFPGVENGRGVTLTPHPLLVPRSRKRVELYHYAPSWRMTGWNLLT